MSAKTRTVGSRKSRQSLERSAGAPEPPDPAAFYCVDPGETAPEYWNLGLAGVCDAIARASWLSVAKPPQRVLVTRPEGGRLPACQDRVIRRFRGGQQIWSAASESPDPGGDPPGGLTLALRGI